MRGGYTCLATQAADQVDIRSDQVTDLTWSAKWCIRFTVFTKPFDTEVMCRLLERLTGHFDRKAHLAVDGYLARHPRKVRT
ncbi:hypothetical protein [Streptomyces sp. NPDC055186]